MVVEPIALGCLPGGHGIFVVAVGVVLAVSSVKVTKNITIMGKSFACLIVMPFVAEYCTVVLSSSSHTWIVPSTWCDSILRVKLRAVSLRCVCVCVWVCAGVKKRVHADTTHVYGVQL